MTGPEQDGRVALSAAGVLQTTPPADSTGRIEGFAPLSVTFNQCRAESILGEDIARYRYDFEGTGGFERGRCREAHVYAAGTYRATVCAGGPDDEACHTRPVLVAEREPRREDGGPVHVLRLSPIRCIDRQPAADFRFHFEPPIPAGQSYSVTLKVDFDSALWRDQAIFSSSTIISEWFTPYGESRARCPGPSRFAARKPFRSPGRQH